MEHIGSVGAGALYGTDSVASSLLLGSEWRPKRRGQTTSAEPLDVQADRRTDGQTDRQMIQVRNKTDTDRM